VPRLGNGSGPAADVAQSNRLAAPMEIAVRRALAGPSPCGLMTLYTRIARHLRNVASDSSSTAPGRKPPAWARDPVFQFFILLPVFPNSMGKPLVRPVRLEEV